MIQLDPLTQFFLEARVKESPFTHKKRAVVPAAYFSLPRLEKHLSNPLLTPDWLQVTLNGKALSFDDAFLWKFVQNRKLCFIDKSRMDDAIGKGASVVLEGLDILDPRIHGLCSEIDVQIPCALINCEAFFSQKNNEAYSGHRDSDDVLVVQIEGSKCWRIHEPQQRRYRGNSPLTEEQMGPLLAEIKMQAGDIMFVRAGVPHRCITEAAYSLHLSFDLCDRIPNIEQITHAANQLYAESLAPMNAPVEEVVKRYIGELTSNRFNETLKLLSQDMKTQLNRFRIRMGYAQNLPSLKKLSR